ncbi:hypothetical protein LCGC14_2045950 [marine sediment metagenome]|uniref:CstA N-terminal domain-containing protein n=1 Tax=marine sediment metagenome TaxID=412755 RepID=A0A0F9EQN2_9ZZZZ
MGFWATVVAVTTVVMVFYDRVLKPFLVKK